MPRLPAVLVLLAPGVALAGMPSFRLTDLAKQRLEALSFFALLFVVVTCAVWFLWNQLQRDVPRLPALSFRSALALVFLWGLGFQLVLSMIAGGRELLTPGAWKKQGFTYQLAEKVPETPLPGDAELVTQARRQRLEDLRTALWAHAAAHAQAFPDHDFAPGVPEERWRVVGGSGLHFIYVGGQRADAPESVLAYEPGLFGPVRWVLFTTGDIRSLPLADIQARLGATP